MKKQKIAYHVLPRQDLNSIRPLWEDLNRMHLDDSVYFKNHYGTFSFEKRSARWRTIPAENLQILVAETDHTMVAYCVATLNEGQQGEIDSLFVLPAYRKLGLGQALVERSMAWLREKPCNAITLRVSYGHEEVFGFYQKMGFFPKATLFEWKETVRQDWSF